MAILCGGIIGVEREKKNHAAGFRTYTLVCLGSALVTMNGEFSLKTIGVGDPTRIAAQVISGIGFLGAGTIILNGKHQIKGLTTAAGIWMAATIGISIGSGFYLGGILSTILVIFILSLFKKIQTNLNKMNKVSRIYIECKNLDIFNNIRLKLIKENIKILDLELLYDNKEIIGTLVCIILVEDKRKKITFTPLEIIENENGVIWSELL